MKFSCSLLHHVQFGDTNEITVLDCTSESGVAVYTLSVCLLLLFTCGLPNMVRQDHAFSEQRTEAQHIFEEEDN